MKKFQAIFGAVCLVLGIGMFCYAQSEIESRPWISITGYGDQINGLRIFGILVMLSGVIDLGICIYSNWYKSKTESSIESHSPGAVTCPTCKLQVKKGTTVCPRCKTDLKF